MNHYNFVSMDVKIESSWEALLSEEFEKPYFQQLVDFVKAEYASYPGQIFPNGNQIFRAFDACPFDDLKVIILGQDPYPTKGHAHGLCFSVEPDVRPLPKSLQNIYKEIESDLGVECPPHGELVRWAEQGVLLLNAVLTVREGSPGAHSGKGWEMFTDAVIQLINERKKNVVYLLWGSHAQKKALCVDTSANLVLKAPHPSPLSAYRGFFGSKHFSKTNAYLLEHGKKAIEW